jgi:amidase
VNGLAGLKPTVGLVSRSGIIPISVSQDTAGPMARTVSDVALLLTAMAGVDPADPSGPAANGKIATDYSTFLKVDALKGRRFGVVRQAMGYHPDVDASTTKAIEAIKAAGGEVIDVKVPTYNDWNDPEFAVLLYEFKDGLNAYLKKSGSPHASLEALIAWNKANATQVMPIFGQEIFEQAQAKGPLSDAAYITARDTARRLAGKDGLIATLDKNKLDALIAPSLSPAWPTDHVLGDHFIGAGYGMAAVARTPSITVPIGESHGLPFGLTFMGRAYSEGELIGFGYALEQVMKARKAPGFKPTLSQ